MHGCVCMCTCVRDGSHAAGEETGGVPLPRPSAPSARSSAQGFLPPQITQPPGRAGGDLVSVAVGRHAKQARLLRSTEVLVEAGFRGLTDVFQDEPLGGGSGGNRGQGGGPPTGLQPEAPAEQRERCRS